MTATDHAFFTFFFKKKENQHTNNLGSHRRMHALENTKTHTWLVAQAETGALVGDVTGGALALTVPATASLSGSCSSWFSSPSTLSLSLRHFQPYLVELLLLFVGPFCRRAAVASARCLAKLNLAIFVYYSYFNIKPWRPCGPTAFKATSTPAIPASLVVS